MIFISYSSKDESIARELQDRLIAKGYASQDLFRDKDYRSGIKLGADWEKVLLQNAKSCRAMIVLCSRNWLKSKWCFAELAVAKNNPTTLILPVVINDLTKDGWQKSGLDKQQCLILDQVDPSQRDAGYEELFLRLEQHDLGRTAYLRPSLEHDPNWLHFRCWNWERWSESVDMKRSLEFAPAQEQFIQSLCETLTVKRCGEIRITGDSGSGKTRLVLEAIRMDIDLQRQVLYYDDPAGLVEDPYVRTLAQTENDDRHIIVVDDCHSKFYQITRNAVEAFKDRIVLVTITHERSDDARVVPPLPVEQIASILIGYRSSLGPMAMTYAECCKDSPRFAHLVGESLKADSNSIASHPDTTQIVERIICGKAGTGNAESNVRLVVARFVSLFDRFGLEAPHSSEVQFIARMIAQFHPSIGIGDVLAACHELRRVRVMQGRRTVYLAPRALQLSLWNQWWIIYGAHFQIKDLADYPEDLRSWFILTLETTPEIAPLRDLATRLLRYDSWFYSWTEHEGFWGPRLFRLFGELCPQQALGRIDRLLRFHDTSELQEKVRSRSGSVSAIIEVLEYASMWRATAGSAMRLLRKIALAETENEYTQATNAFCHFFTLGTGEAASTELAPAERFVVLEEMLLSNNPSEMSLALKACAMALNQHGRGRHLGWKTRGDGTTPELWRPENDQQWINANLQYWNRICEFVLQCSNKDVRVEALTVLGGALFQMAQRQELVDHCILSIQSLGVAIEIEMLRSILKTIAGLWRRATNMAASARVQLRDVYEGIVDRSFETRLKRFAGMTFGIDDSPRGPLESVPISNIEEEVRSLARESCSSPELLRPHLNWLMISAERPWGFGAELGCSDVPVTWWREIISCQATIQPLGNAAFISGYLESVRKRSQSDFHDLLTQVSQTEALAPVFPEIVARTESTPHAYELINQLLDSRTLPPEKLDVLLYIQKLKDVPEPCFANWITHLQRSASDEALGLCLDFLYGRYKHESMNPIPAQMISELLADGAVIRLVASTHGNEKNHAYDWAELLELLTTGYPTFAVEVVRAFFEHFLEESNFYRTAGERHVDPAIWKVMDRQPAETWDHYFDVLQCADEKAAANLIQWLGCKYHFVEGSNLGLWPVVPQDPLWRWIDLDLPVRSQFVGHKLPPIVTEHGLTNVTCQFLRRYYAHCPSVCDSLIGPHVSGIVEGGRDAFNTRRLQHASAARDAATDPQIRIWLERHIEALTSEIERQTNEDESNERGHRR